MSGKICKALAAAIGRFGKTLSAIVLVTATVTVLCGAAFAEGNPGITVTIDCDGSRSLVTMAGGTIEEALELAGIELGELDTIDYPLYMRAGDGDHVTVTRKDILAVTKKVKIPYKKVEILTSLLSPGKERVLVEGKSGIKLESYEQLVVNGKKQQKEYLDEEIISKPVTEKVLVGKAAHPISELDFGYEFDENGEPVAYADVLRGQRAAGYSARAGAKTASGREAVVGHVAVNPKVIPYGSKLYIKSTDGKFVYGYAIAADTGTAIRDGIIAVDLFYGSYMESALNGIKSVDIFILE